MSAPWSVWVVGCLGGILVPGPLRAALGPTSLVRSRSAV